MVRDDVENEMVDLNRDIDVKKSGTHRYLESRETAVTPASMTLQPRRQEALHVSEMQQKIDR